MKTTLMQVLIIKKSLVRQNTTQKNSMKDAQLKKIIIINSFCDSLWPHMGTPWLLLWENRWFGGWDARLQVERALV